MVPIETAIEELNRGDVDLVSSTGDEPVTTPGELVILLERLRDVDGMTHKLPLQLILRRNGMCTQFTTVGITVPADVDAARAQELLRPALSMGCPKPTLQKVVDHVRRVCEFNGWTLEEKFVPETLSLNFNFG